MNIRKVQQKTEPKKVRKTQITNAWAMKALQENERYKQTILALTRRDKSLKQDNNIAFNSEINKFKLSNDIQNSKYNNSKQVKNENINNNKNIQVSSSISSNPSHFGNVSVDPSHFESNNQNLGLASEQKSQQNIYSLNTNSKLVNNENINNNKQQPDFLDINAFYDTDNVENKQQSGFFNFNINKHDPLDPKMYNLPVNFESNNQNLGLASEQKLQQKNNHVLSSQRYYTNKGETDTTDVNMFSGNMGHELFGDNFPLNNKEHTNIVSQSKRIVPITENNQYYNTYNDPHVNNALYANTLAQKQGSSGYDCNAFPLDQSRASYDMIMNLTQQNQQITQQNQQMMHRMMDFMQQQQQMVNKILTQQSEDKQNIKSLIQQYFVANNTRHNANENETNVEKQSVNVNTNSKEGRSNGGKSIATQTERSSEKNSRPIKSNGVNGRNSSSKSNTKNIIEQLKFSEPSRNINVTDCSATTTVNASNAFNKNLVKKIFNQNTEFKGNKKLTKSSLINNMKYYNTIGVNKTKNKPSSIGKKQTMRTQTTLKK